jgi:uncharacterized protein (TIGR02271 family)
MSDPSSIGPGIDDGIVRSEERLEVTTRRRVTGKAVLRKRIVVEQRTITVDVAHEEVELVVVPFDADEDEETEAAHGAHLALPDLVLHREEIVVTKRTVPVERVRVDVRTVTEQREVTEDVRREQVEIVDDTSER